MRIHFPFAVFALIVFQAQAQTATETPTPPAPAAVVAPAPTPSAPHHRTSLAEAFAQANTTHDGHLTPEQAKAGRMYNIVRRFPEIDKDHKGYVTEDEIRSYYRDLRATRRAKEQPAGDTKS